MKLIHGLIQSCISNIEIKEIGSFNVKGEQFIYHKPILTFYKACNYIIEDFNSGILIEEKVEENEGYFRIIQKSIGLLSYGYNYFDKNKATKHGGMWSSNSSALYEITGLEVFDIHIKGSSMGMYSILLKDLIYLLPKEYAIVKYKNESTNKLNYEIVKVSDINRLKELGCDIIEN